MEVHVLHNGYSILTEDGSLRANCTCTLIKGPPNIIVDTMTPWDGDRIIQSLRRHSVHPDDINYVICTHGHSDHTGCNYLFKNAKLIVGFSISFKNSYSLSCDFSKGEEYIINENIKVIPTPGHTMQDVTVIVETSEGKIGITGDLFERSEDLVDCLIWKSAGCDSEELQAENREKILRMVDYIIPGHGPKFEVPKKYKNIS